MQPGQTFAGYRVQRLLGAGGMGQVFEVVNPRLGRLEVLKVLRPDIADADARTRFLREAEYAAKLTHPNVVTIYDAGSFDGHLYLALQRIDGPNLRELLERDGALPPWRAVSLLGGVADALDAAHRSGLVHRDVKPANVLVAPGPPEKAYLTDFGISTLLGQSALTSTGVAVGTFGYMAPELFSGSHGSPRSDVYGLARTFRDAVTWTRPGQPPPMIDPGLRAVVAKGCADDPGQRFETCGAFMAAAWRAVNATTAALPARPHGRRRWFVAAGIAAAVLGLVLALASRGGGGSPLVPTPTPSRSATYLDLAAPTSASETDYNRGLVQVGGKSYPHGVSLDTSGEFVLSYAVPPGATSFRAQPGFDDDNPNCSGCTAEFSVLVDGLTVVKETGEAGAAPPNAVDVPVSGHQTVTVRIKVTSGGATVDWADPHFT